MSAPVSIAGKHDSETVIDNLSTQEEIHRDLRSTARNISPPLLHDSVVPRHSLPGGSRTDTQEVCKWYFMCQLPANDHALIETLHKYWVKEVWDMRYVNQPMSAVVSALAFQKKVRLAGQSAIPQYYEQKCRATRSVATELEPCSDSPSSLTILAVSILALLDIRDVQLDAAELHLRTACRLVDVSKLSLQGWLYFVWIDLQYALLTCQEPGLCFYVPIILREVPSKLKNCHLELSRLGTMNAYRCPRSHLLGVETASDLFGKLHALCRYPATSSSSERPPFGQVYAVEYSLRLVQAQATTCGESKDDFSTILITSATQLHLWMAARSWVPQNHEMHETIIARACETINRFDDVITRWCDSADIGSLVWVLFVLVAGSRTHHHLRVTTLLELLYELLQKAGVVTCESLEVKLKEWPWLADWHPRRLLDVWTMLQLRYPDLDHGTNYREGRDWRGETRRTNDVYFVGGLEFFNSGAATERECRCSGQVSRSNIS